MYTWKRTYFITSRVIQSMCAEIGFLSDIRRMNVGMTRARRKLLLVGDSSTLCRHPFFGELLAYVKGVGGYRTAHEMGKQISVSDGHPGDEGTRICFERFGQFTR